MRGIHLSGVQCTAGLLVSGDRALHLKAPRIKSLGMKNPAKKRMRMVRAHALAPSRWVRTHPQPTASQPSTSASANLKTRARGIRGARIRRGRRELQGAGFAVQGQVVLQQRALCVHRVAGPLSRTPRDAAHRSAKDLCNQEAPSAAEESPSPHLQPEQVLATALQHARKVPQGLSRTPGAPRSNERTWPTSGRRDTCSRRRCSRGRGSLQLRRFARDVHAIRDES